MKAAETGIRLAVVIPMYNEALGAARCIRAVCGVLSSIPGSKLIAVDDGSTDDTAAVIRRLQPEEPLLELVTYKVNRGYGAATACGIDAALAGGFEYGLFMDSDLTNDPALIPAFLEAIVHNGYDVVKASRYVQGGGMLGVPAYRQRYTIVGNKIASALFGMGLKDCTNAFRAVRLEL
jgi:dolichol-phosphate mannosyltransferase